MTITTGMHPSLAAAKADLVYDANDDLGWEVTCFFSISAKYHPRDRSTGDAGGWECDATLIGCQIGDLVLGDTHAMKALVGDVKMLERVAGEYESDRLNDEDMV
jgi:hypothetical protein